MIVCSFYKFINIDDTNLFKKLLLHTCKDRYINGTFILAKEGINASFSGEKKAVQEVQKFLKKKVGADISFKLSTCTKNPFLRLRVKVKKEIIKLGVGEIWSGFSKGEYIKPENWNDFIDNKNVVLVDTRNKYESEIGFFENSVFPETKNFSEFPKWIKKNEHSFKNKTIAMYCTGGVRCEKASSYLISAGYKNIYQLEGGILSYIEKVDEKKSKWKGECFVFDERVSIDHSLKKGQYTQCFACRSALSKKDIESSFYTKGVSCHKCYLRTTHKQKQNFKEREKQIQIAKSRGRKHLGIKSQKKL